MPHVPREQRADCPPHMGHLHGAHWYKLYILMCFAKVIGVFRRSGAPELDVMKLDVCHTGIGTPEKPLQLLGNPLLVQPFMRTPGSASIFFSTS